MLSKYNEILNEVINRKLGKSINLLKKNLELLPPSIFNEQLYQIEKDYDLMLSFYQQGYSDNHRDSLYLSLLQRLACLINNIHLNQTIENNSSLRNRKNKVDKFSCDFDKIEAHLSDFIAERTILDLDEEINNNARKQEIFQSHQDFMDNIFDTILLSNIWTNEEYERWKRILLSPIIEHNDSLLVISALFLANSQFFDVAKFKLLLELSSDDSVDQHISQRALVGWALTLNSQITLYPDIVDDIKEFCNQPKNVKQLVELQKQMYYCLNAEKDNEEIQRDIMPDLIRNSNINITRFGIEEKDENSIDEILGNKSDDEAIDKVEQSMKKMFDMQKAGSDIYFGGFSQMKRFSFFYKTSNWFVPFYIQHPDIQQAVQQIGNENFTNVLLNNSAFCDSDKYSFVLAVSSIINRLPNNIREMLGNDGIFELQKTENDAQSATYIRRMYLQDLYRFFKVYTNKSLLKNPFSCQHGRAHSALFVDYDIFRDTELYKSLTEIGAFLLKQTYYEDLQHLLDAIGNDKHIDAVLLKSKCLIINKDYHNVIKILNSLDSKQHDNKEVLQLLAKSYTAVKRFEEAASCYEKLLSDSPENLNLSLKYCLVLGHTPDRMKSLDILYKLSFEHADNISVLRVLAWNLLLTGKLEQARVEFTRLLSDSQHNASDLFNAGYFYWLTGDTNKAIESFKDCFKATQQEALYDSIKKQFYDDIEVLNYNRVSDNEINMMIDCICYR